MTKKISFFFLFIWLLVACAGSPAGTPEQAVESYLQAIVAQDEVEAINSSCVAWEQQAVLESAAYQGVEAQLENLECQVLVQDGESAAVSCSGQIRYSYAGGEDQIDDLAGRVFSAVVESGEWKFCGLASAPEESQAEPTATDALVVQDLPTSTQEPTRVPTPAGTPTPDIRPLAADWRNWPIVPTLSPWLVDVYARGLEQGNDPSHFSKAGDCQNIPEAFLGFYDIAGRYRLTSSDEYLQDTIDFFAGSWGRDSIAVDGGFNFPAIFTSLRADPELCDEGENPLACEIRLHKPSFMFVSMEFVYEGRTAENFEQYLRETVEYVLSQNVIPILITKADNVEGGHTINLATAQVAYDYDVPLYNWWRAAQPLEGHGIDWTRDEGQRPEGFHITYEAWSVRSYWALRTLDALLAQLKNAGIGEE